MQLLNLADYEVAATRRVPPAAWGYLAGGANDEITVGENRRAWDQIALAYRTMIDVSHRSLATTVLGTPISMPVLVAPTAMHCLVHPDGEPATARAAHDLGTIMCVSTTATTSVEDCRAAAPGPMWFQLYIYRDRSVTADLLERVKQVGYDAVMLTVDAPLIGRRERDIRLGFSLPPHLQLTNAARAGAGTVPTATARESGLNQHARGLHDTAITDRDIAWIRDVSGLPVVVKGIVRPDDALRAVDAGAAAVVVSNHGGRQLDGAVATARVLGPIAKAVRGRGEVYVDGGIRRGTDVLKALALGARAVLLGRPVLWGLAVGGEQGVRDVLQLLQEEVDLAMALSGCGTVDDITPDLIA